MKTKIAICDDEYIHRKILLQYTKKLFSKDIYEILEIMKSDKKNSFGNINLVIPVGRGKVKVFDDIKDDEILDVIKRCMNA